MPTNVPAPQWTPNGFVAPAESALLEGALADMQAAFGGNLNPSLTTPQGQLATSLAAILGNVNDTFLFYASQVDPAFAVGRMQDAIARIYFIERNPAISTVLQVSCSGALGTSIQPGALLSDPSDGDLIICTMGGTIGTNGFVVLPFAYVIPGPEPVPPVVAIFNGPQGWDSASVVSGVVGQNAETPAQFEQRRAQSVAANSMGNLPAVLGAVLQVANVTDAIAVENSAGTQILYGASQVPIAANSIFVSVVGGSDAAVAQAIWTKKMPGCGMSGNRTVVVQDTNSGYNTPFPAYNITFERPYPTPCVLAVYVVNSPNVPGNATSLIQTAVINAWAGGDGGPKSRVGSNIYAMRFAAPIVALGPWAVLSNLSISSQNTPDATFTGSIGGTTLTVSSMGAGSIAIGQTIEVTGSIGVGVVKASTQIVSFGTGNGGTGTYNVNQAQTVGTHAMASFFPDQAVVSVGADQQPTIAAADIQVFFQ